MFPFIEVAGIATGYLLVASTNDQFATQHFLGWRF